MRIRLSNVTALFTGVVSGIGLEIATMLAERGARVFGRVRRPPSAVGYLKAALTFEGCRSRGIGLFALTFVSSAAVRAAKPCERAIDAQRGCRS
jgi:NAD(P)-dependent dehydrogenase (short-subunit alcohol dehydrogenase family)